MKKFLATLLIIALALTGVFAATEATSIETDIAQSTLIKLYAVGNDSQEVASEWRIRSCRVQR